MTTADCQVPCRRGSVLVLTIWLLMILGLLVLGLTRSTQVESAMGFGEVERTQARWLARAGVEQALAVLAADLKDSDGEDESWFDSPLYFDEVALAEGFTFSVTAPPTDEAAAADPTAPRYGLSDEASRLNVNVARGNQMRRLEGFTAAQAAAIVDWRDNNEQARAGGAERAYYDQLDYPYQIRNGDFRTLRELLLVKGIEPGEFFGEDGNLNGILDANENDGADRWPDDTPDRVLERGLASRLTVYSYEANTNPFGAPRTDLSEADAATLTFEFDLSSSLAEKVVEAGRDADSLFDFLGLRGDGQPEDQDQTHEITIDWLAENWESLTLEDDERRPAKININTASREVLESVPGMRPRMAQAILDQRAAQGSFSGVGELYSRQVLGERRFRGVAEQLTTRSNVFRVLSEGRTPSGTRYALAVVVDRGGTRPVVLDWRRP